MPNALFLSQLSLGTPKYHLVAKNFLLGHLYGIDITLYMWIFLPCSLSLAWHHASRYNPILSQETLLPCTWRIKNIFCAESLVPIFQSDVLSQQIR